MPGTHLNLFFQRELTLIEAFEYNCQHYPEKKFITYQDKVYTYQEVCLKANGFAEFLFNKGVRKYDKVTIIMQKIPELIIAFLGIMKIGAIPAPINYTLKNSDFNAFVNRVQAKAIVMSAEFVSPLTNQILDNNSILKIIVNGERSGFSSWPEACMESSWRSPFIPALNDIAYLNYTTGSTGIPKGALATHKNLYWNTRAAVEAMGIDQFDIHLCLFAAFAHPHEIFTRAIYTGGSVVLLEKINPKTIVQTINKHNVTCMMGLAPMYEMVLSHCADQQLKSLRIAESGGMYTRPDVSGNFKKCFGLPILSVWGSTETSGIALANTPESHRIDGSMGKPCPYYEVTVVDDSGNELKTNEVGELIFRGKGVIDGYGQDAPFPGRDGWYYSGDIGKKDSEGFFYFTERKSGLIKVAGLKVYPLQVELKLKEFPGIKEIAVIGVKERRHGMVPKAFIVAEDNVTLDVNEIILFCTNQLANYMIPKSIEFCNELPKIGSGKIDKKALSLLSE